MTGVLHAALSGAAGRPAFVPYAWEFAAHRAGMSTDEMEASASRIVAALCDVRLLLDTDALVLPIADLHEPAVEALGRLASMSRDSDLVAVVPGPAQLAALRGLDDLDDAEEEVVDLVRGVLAARCTVIGVDVTDDADAVPVLRSIGKTAGFFGARSFVIGDAIDPAAVIESGIDAVDRGSNGPAMVGVSIAPATREHVPATSVVTSSWRPRPTGDDADWLMTAAKRLREVKA